MSRSQNDGTLSVTFAVVQDFGGMASLIAASAASFAYSRPALSRVIGYMSHQNCAGQRRLEVKK